MIKIANIFSGSSDGTRINIVTVSPSTYISVKVLAQCLYVNGLVKIVLWEESLENVKSVILEQPSTIINLFLTIQNAIIHLFDDEPSEIDIFRSRKQKELTLAEMVGYFRCIIDVYDGKFCYITDFLTDEEHREC